MSKIKVTFVILHYQNIDVTKECVKNLKEINQNEIVNLQIVVVDNCSPNNTGIKLKEIYLDEKNIKVLINNKNEGFARGNNLGYKYAKEHLKSNVIIHINSDLMIRDREFFSKLLQVKYNNKHIALIGPDIINLSQQHQNPYKMKPTTDNKLREYYLKNIVLQMIYKVPYLNKRYIEFKINKDKNEYTNNNWQKDKINAVLHGSCIIFLEKWIEKEEFAFVPITFLFMEEDILYDYAINRGYNTLYTNSISVEHWEDASIDSEQANNVSKQKFIMKNQKKSMESLMRLRKDINKGFYDEKIQ